MAEMDKRTDRLTDGQDA